MRGGLCGTFPPGKPGNQRARPASIVTRFGGGFQVFWRPTRISGNGVGELNSDGDDDVSVEVVLTVEEAHWAAPGPRRRLALRSGTWRGKARDGSYSVCRGSLFVWVRWGIDATVQCSPVGAQSPHRCHGKLQHRLGCLGILTQDTGFRSDRAVQWEDISSKCLQSAVSMGPPLGIRLPMAARGSKLRNGYGGMVQR